MDGKEKTKSRPFDYHSYNIPQSYSKNVTQTVQMSNEQQRPIQEQKQPVYETDNYQVNNEKYYDEGVYEEDEPAYYSFGDYVRNDKVGQCNEASESEECYDSEEYFANYESGEAQYYELEKHDRQRVGEVRAAGTVGYDERRYDRTQYYQLRSPGKGQYEQYCQAQQKSPGQNTDSSSCPVLPNGKSMSKDHIYRQVNKKIDETVAELRNAGLHDNKGRITSDPELDYSKRHSNDYPLGVSEGQAQRQTFNQKISYAAAQRNRLQEEVYNQLARQRALKQQIKEQRALQQQQSPDRTLSPASRIRYTSPTYSREWENSNAARYENDKMYQKNVNQVSPNRPSSRQYNTQEPPLTESRPTKSVKFTDLKNKTQNVDSFVELHASSDQMIPECCRQVYDDYRKTSYAQKSSQYE